VAGLIRPRLAGFEVTGGKTCRKAPHERHNSK